jgi:hypothetical protein
MRPLEISDDALQDEMLFEEVVDNASNIMDIVFLLPVC